MAPAEDLYAPARQWRTLGMAVDMLLLPAGAIILVASVLPDAALSRIVRAEFAVAGAALVVVALLTLRLFVLAGRKVGAVYGVKAAQRAGLLPEEPNSRRSSASEPSSESGTTPAR